MRRFLTLALIAAPLLGACGGSVSPAPTVTTVAGVTATPTTRPATQVATPTAGETGIEGVVLLGPTCPVQRVDSPCPDRPYVATIDVVDVNSGVIVATVTSDPDGRFRVEIAPGAYRLVPRNTSTLPRGVEQAVTVVAGQVTSVQVAYDTGIR